MGTFLSQPVTEQETDEALLPNAHGLSYGVSSMQGWRSGTEGQRDAIAAIAALSSLLPSSPSWSPSPLLLP